MHTIKWSQHWMLVFVPIALVLEHVPGISRTGHVPRCGARDRSGRAPDRRAAPSISRTTPATRSARLLNTMFGNLPELIICVVALKAGLYAMVAASLVGAILFNLLLVLGLSFLLGGLRHHTLEFNVNAVRMYSTMMFIAVISLALPSIYEQAFAPGGATIEQEKINIGLAVLLLVLYGLYLLYMIRHASRGIRERRQGRRRRSTKRPGACRCASACSIGSSVLAALLSEVLVGAVEGTGEALGLSTAFLGIVLLASVGGVAEGMSAITMARKGRFDLSLGIALGSCILIALFVAPVLVFASYFVGPQPFQLSFNGGGVGLLFLVGAHRHARRVGRLRQLVQGRAAHRRVSDDRAAALLRAALSRGHGSHHANVSQRPRRTVPR